MGGDKGEGEHITKRLCDPPLESPPMPTITYENNTFGGGENHVKYLSATNIHLLRRRSENGGPGTILIMMYYLTLDSHFKLLTRKWMNHL
jgi:hypothetical protein